MLKRILFFAYGTIAYALFLMTFLYAIGFVGNIGVPKSIDAPEGGTTLPVAIAINATLLTVFALQHSIMARQWFKRIWTRVVPTEIERSTFVLASCAALGLMFWQWQPMGGTIWKIEDEFSQMALLAIFGLGWALVLVSTFLIDHFDLFGLRQVWLALKNQPYTHHEFAIKSLYKYVRHPLYLGFLIAFWAAPTMTAARMFFALITTAYILTAIQWEEKDLVEMHGEAYTLYRKVVPKILPQVPGTAQLEEIKQLAKNSGGLRDLNSADLQRTHN